MAAKAQQPWYLYLLECENGYLYCGISTDVERRFLHHQQGKGARFTRINPPLRILGTQRFADRSGATIAELQLKRLPRKRKLQWAERVPGILLES
ncbi:MAG: GIY-YIG nuclease family protein [Gammaproteobacteria bacterium]|jgi:putative endonuclease|nr:GIY-YIG nuclease family protein [Gammaproteobacteria bacterium]